ncbi:HpaA family protein, partial [Helicobacter pylori]
YKQSNSGGFNSSDSIIHEDLEKNKEDAIHKILNRMYAVVMKKAVTELTEENIAKYRDAIDRMKGFKSSMPQKK